MRRAACIRIASALLLGSAFWSCRPPAYTETGIVNLTQLTSDKSVEIDPCFTKDGSKLVFASDRSGFLEIWMMPI